MFAELIAVVVAVGCALAFLEWWRGPEIPRD